MFYNYIMKHNCTCALHKCTHISQGKAQYGFLSSYYSGIPLFQTPLGQLKVS